MFIESSRMSVLFLILRLPKRRKFVSHTMSQIFSWMLLPSIFKILLMESNQKFNFLISRISEKSVTCKTLEHYIYQTTYKQQMSLLSLSLSYIRFRMNLEVATLRFDIAPIFENAKFSFFVLMSSFWYFYFWFSRSIHSRNSLFIDWINHFKQELLL